MKSLWKPSVAIVACLVAFALAGEWLYFRATHVVAAHAFVKGGVVEAGAPVAGQVVAVAVSPGDRVKAGDVLVRFNDVRERAELSRARAAVELARRKLVVEQAQIRLLYDEAKMSTGQAEANLRVSRAEERTAAIDAELSRARLTRTSKLREQDMVPEEENESSEAAERMAQSKAERARGKLALAQALLGGPRLQLARANAREANRGLLLADLLSAEAEVQAAEAALGLCTVRALHDGVVSRRLVEPGSAVRLGAPLLTLWYDENLGIEAWIDESAYGALPSDAQAEVRLSGLPGTVLTGTLQWLGVVTESELKEASYSIPLAKKLGQSRWVRARVVLVQDHPRLLPGLTAYVTLPNGGAHERRAGTPRAAGFACTYFPSTACAEPAPHQAR